MPNSGQSVNPIFPTSLDQVPEAVRLTHYTGGTRFLLSGKVYSWDGPCQKVLSPVCIGTGDELKRHPLGEYPLMGEKEALEALAAAEQAYDNGRGVWPALSVAERIRHMESFVPRMVAVREEVVKLLMWEIGKSLPDAQKEFDRTVEYIRNTLDALKDVDRTGSRFIVEQGFVAQVRRSPLGVVLCMGPFNYPLNETFTTLIPALLMGNTVVFKPPRHGVLLHAPLLEAFAESFPPGVVNTVYGRGAAVLGPLMQSGRVDVLAFIGSAKAASILKHQHPRPNRLRCVLGLEAKNPAVVLPDADIDLAVQECVLGAFSYNGQRCTAIKIIFVHRSLTEVFCERLAAQVSALKIGMPWDPGVQITPLPEEEKPEWLRGLVEEAVAGGAHILNAGGGRIDHTLFYPAVLHPVPLHSQLSQVEQFGPVLPIVSYDDEEEVVRWTTESSVGQQAALFGQDPYRLSRLVDTLVNQVCRVNINSQCQRGPDTLPFTGRKDSAEGTLSVSDALRAFSIRSLVACKANEKNEAILSTIVRGRHSRFLSTDFIF